MSEERYNLPDGWAWVVLEDIVSCLESGSRPRGGVRQIKEGVPSIGGEHLTYEGKFDFDKIRYVPIVFFEKMSKGHIEKRDILIVKDGATTGKTSFVDESFPFREATINEHVFKLRTFDDYIIPQYLFYFLYSHTGNRQMLDCFQGSAQGGINQSFVNKVHIPISPYNQQKHIVEKIENLFDRLNKTKRELAKIPPLLKKFRQSLLTKAFSGKLAKEWREQQKDLEPASALLERIRHDRKERLGKRYEELEPLDASNLPELPKGWTRVRIGECCLVNPRHRSDILPSDTQVSFVPMPAIDAEIGAITNPESRPLEKVIKGFTHFIEGDVLFAKITPCMENGKAAIAKDLLNDVGCGTTELHVLRPLGGIMPEYIYHYVRQQSFRNRAEANMTGTAGQLRVPVNFMKNELLPIPSIKEQEEIIKEINDFFIQTAAIARSVKIAKTHCEKLSQSILGKAFRGELVKQHPDDEPASILLEKIKSEKGRMSMQNRVGSDA